MTKWLVETRYTGTRFYRVEADNEKDALDKSTDATPDYEEDDNEETMTITQIKD